MNLDEIQHFKARLVGGGPFDGKLEIIELKIGEELPHRIEKGYGYVYEKSDARPEDADVLYVFKGIP